MLATFAIFAALLVAAPTEAELNAYYKGTQWMKGTTYPATAQFSCEKGRVAVTMTGAVSYRIIFLEDQKVLRLVNDTSKQYTDLEAGMYEGLMAEVEGQLAQLPPEEQETTRQMMEASLKQAQLPPLEYVWTDQKEQIQGYECTRVDALEGKVRKSDYWGTPSDDFKITSEEQASVAKMREYLGTSDITVLEGAEGTRAFLWDTRRDGFPLRMHCYDHDSTTVALEMVSFDRKPLAKELFEIPKGYKEQSF
jgi:hypothetical protein